MTYTERSGCGTLNQSDVGRTVQLGGRVDVLGDHGDVMFIHLHDNGVVEIQGVDMRALTKHIREAGAMQAVISTSDLNPASLVTKARQSPGLTGRDRVRDVTCPSSRRSFTRRPDRGRTTRGTCSGGLWKQCITDQRI